MAKNAIKIVPTNQIRELTPASSVSATKVARGLSTATNSPVKQGGVGAINRGLANTVAQGNAVSEAQPAQQTPSMSYLDILSAYEAQARANFAAQQAELAKQLASSKASTSSNYDSAAAGNYVNYIKQQNALGEQLAAQGIRGGASESALARIGNNYALNQGSTNASRYGALAQLQSAYDTNIANLRSAMEDRILDTGLSLKQAQLQYEDTLAQREYERKIREEDIARAERERAEDIAREQQNRAEDIARDERWKKLEWNKTLRDQKLEQYAAGTEQYVTMSDIKKINNVIAKIKTDKNWKKNKFKYGQVKALQARIGWIKQYNDNK